MIRQNLGGYKTPLLLLLIAVLAGCEQKSREQRSEVEPPVQRVNKRAAETLSNNLWLAGQAQLRDAQAAVGALNRAIEALLQNPSDDQLNAAKLTWLEAHRQFAGSLPYIHLGFAAEQLQPQGSQLLLALDSWPTQAGYLDTVPGYSSSGIVNDTTIALTLANVRKQHRLTDHEEASTGFHALEVMLWGPTSERQGQQFVAVSTGKYPQGLAVNRRRVLTRLIGRGIGEDLDRLTQRWPFAANDLSQHYLALGPRARLQRVRATHLRLLDEEVLRRLPESSESDVESSRAADSKQSLLAILGVLRGSWVPAEGLGMASLLLDQRQARALTEAFVELEGGLLAMEDPIELTAPEQLLRARHQIKTLVKLIAGQPQVPIPAE